MKNMGAVFGWALAAVALVAGGALYGWRGVLLALSIVVFWLLLQFTRVMRAMRAANEGPLGHVASAVMLNAKLSAGMRLVDLLLMTRSLGVKQPRPADAPAGEEAYLWRDNSGAQVTVHLGGGRVTRWDFTRTGDAPESSPEAAPPA
jgi:hypothetical protein